MIKSVVLTDFRNHALTRVVADGYKNIIITGPNGSGKTAVLEAISMLGGERGMRGASMTDIARFNASCGFSVFAHLTDDTEISVSYSAGDSNRRAKIDGDTAPLSDLGTYLRIIWLTPKEDRLFLDSASDRRAFFDRLVSNFDASHFGRTARLSKLLSERGYALKSGANEKLVDALDIQIAATSVAVAAQRIRYAGEINYFLENCAVSVSGQIESWLLSNDADAVEKMYLGYLMKNRLLVGDKMIIEGAHKSDFGIFNNVLNLPVHMTSTGQQKSALIDLMLAHAKLLRTKTDKRPLILLDEAAAHLDKNAIKRMFAELATADAQVWATCLDIEVFKNISDASFVACNNGKIF